MHTRYLDIPAHVRERLLVAQRQGGFGQGSFFLKRTRPWLLWMGLIALGAGGLCLALVISLALYEGAREKVAILVSGLLAPMGLFYGIIALVEFFRTLRADLKPFILVTPTNIVQCKGSHRPLAIFRLGEATAFNQANEYDRENWKGMNYVFSFGPKERVAFLIKRQQEVATLDEVLVLAKAKGKGEALPDWAGAREGDLQAAAAPAEPVKGLLEQLLDPASEFWIAVAAFVLIGIIVAIATSRH